MRIDKKSQKVSRLFFEWGCATACGIAIVQNGSSLAYWSVVVLVVMGGCAASVAAWEQGWFRAPYRLGIPIKVGFVLIAIWTPMIFVGAYAWQKVGTGPDARAYLSSSFLQTSLDPKMDGVLYVRILTTNRGKLQVLPGTRQIFGYARIRNVLTPDEEEELFNTFNVGGGPATAIGPDKNYGTREILCGQTCEPKLRSAAGRAIFTESGRA